jgi:hypothetical protein
LGAAQGAARNLLRCGNLLDPLFKQRVQDLADAKRSDDWYEVLAAVQALNRLKIIEQDPRSPQGIVLRLTAIVSGYTFMHYFWMKEQREKSS